MTDTKQQKNRVRGWVVGGGIVLFLAVAAYFAFGYVIYDQLTVVHPHCESAYVE